MKAAAAVLRGMSDGVVSGKLEKKKDNFIFLINLLIVIDKELIKPRGVKLYLGRNFSPNPSTACSTEVRGTWSRTKREEFSTSMLLRSESEML